MRWCDPLSERGLWTTVHSRSEALWDGKSHDSSFAIYSFSEGKNFNCISSSLISLALEKRTRRRNRDEINQIARVFRLLRFEYRLNYIFRRKWLFLPRLTEELIELGRSNFPFDRSSRRLVAKEATSENQSIGKTSMCNRIMAQRTDDERVSSLSSRVFCFSAEGDHTQQKCRSAMMLFSSFELHSRTKIFSISGFVSPPRSLCLVICH